MRRADLMTQRHSPDEHTSTLRPFAGQVVVFTGKLSSIGRREAHALVGRLGGLAADEVTARTTMLVVGAERFPVNGSSPGVAQAEEEKTNKLRKVEQVNARSPGRVRILTEEEFCRLGGLASPESIKHQYYGLKDIRDLYPAVREDRLRYLEQWGLIRPAARTNADRYYGFSDLLVIKQVHAELQQGAPFRAVLRTLLAGRSGQLALDFRPPPGEAQPAKVVALERRAPRPDVAALPTAVPTPEGALAAKYFREAAALDEGEDGAIDRAIEAYRKALVLDPTLVPALVNLANCHYARDELVEAQALYERAINLDPDCFEAHYNLGNILHDLGRLAEAEACYRDALELNPGYADAHFYLAVTLEKIGRSADAKPFWRSYQRLAPDGEWVELAREFSD